MAHGGGGKSSECEVEGCTRKARGGTTLCISHGIWTRCAFLGCVKTALQVSQPSLAAHRSPPPTSAGSGTGSFGSLVFCPRKMQSVAQALQDRFMQQYDFFHYEVLRMVFLRCVFRAGRLCTLQYHLRSVVVPLYPMRRVEQDPRRGKHISRVNRFP